jgi:hypothetical protein
VICVVRIDGDGKIAADDALLADDQLRVFCVGE